MSDERPFDAPETTAIHADRDLNATDAVAPPIWQTATFSAATDEAFLEAATEVRSERFYARYGTPNHSQAAAVIARLEGAETGILSASGMGAISSTVLTFVGAGDHVVGQRSLYAGSLSLLEEMLPRFGVEVTLVDQRDPVAFERAIRPTTRVVLVETPSNPLMQITDLAAVAALASARGAITIADNTFATPVNQRPIESGVDLVVHSATKFLGGHSDLVAGAVVGREELVDRVWKTSIVLGASLGPFDAWLLLRGLRTLALRVERHNATAGALARFLEEHPAVERVHYAGLASHPQHELARRQMSGFGGVLSFEMHGGFDAARAVVGGMRIARRAPSLGGVESLVAHPASMWAASKPEQLEAAGIRPALVRLSVGLENERDLVEDLDAALATIAS
jgi:methionine-gamma-lyase